MYVCMYVCMYNRYNRRLDLSAPLPWFKGGLLKDLEYYRPFRSPVVKEPEPALA